MGSTRSAGYGSEFPALFDADVTSVVQQDPPSTGPGGPSIRVRMTVAYKGKDFAGFAPNPGVRTVTGVLTESLERILGHPVALGCAGRTDAGVHAWGQVVHFDTSNSDLDLVRLAHSINKICGPEVVIREAQVASSHFDARHSALARHYRYTILNRSEPDPFSVETAWYIEEPLDLSVMRLGCDPLIGTHDFAAFCRRPKVRADENEKSLIRRVRSAAWRDLGEGFLRFDISAESFCHQMVRSIVGTLVEIGLGKKRAGDMSAILRSKDRSKAGPVAPPMGLMLWEVSYGLE